MLQLAAPKIATSMVGKLLPYAPAAAAMASRYVGDKVASKIASAVIAASKPKKKERKRREEQITSNFVKAPVSIGQTLNFKSGSQMKSVKHKIHGDGIRLTTTNLSFIIGSNGVSTNNDNLLPVQLASLNSSYAASGFQSADDGYISGVKLTPEMFGERAKSLIRQFSRWRLNSLNVYYEAQVGTNIAGNLIMAYTSDPCALVEAGGFQNYVDLEADPKSLSQCTPNTSTNVWKSANLRIVNKDDDFLYVPYFNSSGTVSNTSYGDMAWLRTALPGRLAFLYSNGVGAAYYGRIWFQASFDLYGECSDSFVIAGLLDQALDDEKKVGLPKFKHEALYKTSTRKWSVDHHLPKQKDSLKKVQDKPVFTGLDDEKSSIKLSRKLSESDGEVVETQL